MSFEDSFISFVFCLGHKSVGSRKLAGFENAKDLCWSVHGIYHLQDFSVFRSAVDKTVLLLPSLFRRSVLPKGLLWLFETLYGSSRCFYFWDVVFCFKLEILLSAGIIGICHRAKGLCVWTIKILISRLWDGVRRCHWCLKVATRYLLRNYVSLFLSL